MQCLTPIESDRWLQERGLSSKDPLAGSGEITGRSLASIDAARTFPVANALAFWLMLDEPPSCLAWVTQSGVWPSSENLALYYTWRRALGDSFHMDDRPGHLFLQHERNDLASLVQMALTFGWDLSLYSAHADAIATLDHDGRLSLRARHKERLALVPDLLRG